MPRASSDLHLALPPLDASPPPPSAAARSPPHSPRRPRASPPPSPPPPPPPQPAFTEPTPVSFSEYVASELARDQAAQEPFAVSFGASTVDQAAVVAAAGADPFDSESDEAVNDGLVDHPVEAIPRSETEPNLPVAAAPIKPSHSAQKRAHFSNFTHIPSRASLPAPNKARYTDGKLDCIQIDMQGNVTNRQMRRADILQEARSTFPGSQPPPHVVNKWLNGDAPLPSPELKQFSRLFEPNAVANRKTAQKALRDYLRNSLQARDIRQVDPAFAAKPALWVRHSAIVVSLEGLRAIILYNKMFLFDPTTEKTQQLLYIAKQSITAQPDAENPQPFEFRALEGILIYLAMGLETEFGRLKPQIEEYLHQMPNELTTKMLEELRLKKQQLNQFHARANSVRSVLENLLDEDEEMASMYLTEKHISENYARSAVDHSEVETLLEAYLQAIDLHVNHASLLNDAIEDTEDLIMIHLDTLRNRLLSVELAMSVVSMMFGFGGVVAGVFGMNITIPLFDATASRFWFLAVVLVIAVTVICVSWLVLVMLRRRGLYSFY
ncbi:mrs2 [Gracilaria domingensis]|nr:mrs2 [Gracilaria domingensis]